MWSILSLTKHNIEPLMLEYWSRLLTYLHLRFPTSTKSVSPFNLENQPSLARRLDTPPSRDTPPRQNILPHLTGFKRPTGSDWGFWSKKGARSRSHKIKLNNLPWGELFVPALFKSNAELLCRCISGCCIQSIFGRLLVPVSWLKHR